MQSIRFDVNEMGNNLHLETPVYKLDKFNFEISVCIWTQFCE